MSKDAIGNDLKVGQLVRLVLSEPAIIGRIEKISDGGIIAPQSGILGQKGMEVPARVLVSMTATITLAPNGRPTPGLLVLRDPEKDRPVVDAAN